MNSYVVTIRRKESEDLIDVVFVTAQNEKGVAKKLKRDYKSHSFYIKEFEMKDKENLLIK